MTSCQKVGRRLRFKMLEHGEAAELRRDVIQNLLSNICMSDEMMPYPRSPTNPWTNSPLTLSQVISLCGQIVMDYAKRGSCPPVLFSAYFEARFSLKRFLKNNSAMLSQHAIFSYFKDLTVSNIETVYDTIAQLVTESGLNYSHMAVRRWLNVRPQTDLHREWLLLVRDYTVYMNLHVQIRPHWIDTISIRNDVRQLYEQTIPMRRLNTILSNPIILDPALFLIQSALFRL